MKPCAADGTMGPWDNVVPYYLQAVVPGQAAQRTFELRLQGWQASALYTVQPQAVEVRRSIAWGPVCACRPGRGGCTAGDGHRACTDACLAGDRSQW